MPGSSRSRRQRAVRSGAADSATPASAAGSASASHRCAAGRPAAGGRPGARPEAGRLGVRAPLIARAVLASQRLQRLRFHSPSVEMLPLTIRRQRHGLHSSREQSGQRHDNSARALNCLFLRPAHAGRVVQCCDSAQQQFGPAATALRRVGLAAAASPPLRRLHEHACGLLGPCSPHPAPRQAIVHRLHSQTAVQATQTATSLGSPLPQLACRPANTGI